MFTKFRNPDLGLLLLRLVLAYEFITHSWQKLSNSAMSIGFFTKLGLPYPKEFMYFICTVEMLGGILMLLGVWTELAGLFLACDMLGVILVARSGPMAHGWLAGHDFEFTLLAASLAIALVGAGRFALMRPKEKQQLV